MAKRAWAVVGITILLAGFTGDLADHGREYWYGLSTLEKIALTEGFLLGVSAVLETMDYRGDLQPGWLDEYGIYDVSVGDVIDGTNALYEQYDAPLFMTMYVGGKIGGTE